MHERSLPLARPTHLLGQRLSGKYCLPFMAALGGSLTLAKENGSCPSVTLCDRGSRNGETRRRNRQRPSEVNRAKPAIKAKTTMPFTAHLVKGALTLAVRTHHYLSVNLDLNNA